MVNYLKAISSYTESELAEAADVLDEDQRKTLLSLADRLHKRLKTVNTDRIEGKDKSKKLQTVTMEQKFISAVSKIRKALEKYRSTDSVVEWKLQFKIGLEYEKTTFEEIQAFHNELIKSESNAEHVKLLIYVERGRMYDYLKYSQDAFGKWETLCTQLGICRKTADRYIDLSRIFNAYPRILTCELSFVTMQYTYKKLHVYLETTEDLANQLKEPLGQMHISSNHTVQFSSIAR